MTNAEVVRYMHPDKSYTDEEANAWWKKNITTLPSTASSMEELEHMAQGGDPFAAVAPKPARSKTKMYHMLKGQGYLGAGMSTPLEQGKKYRFPTDTMPLREFTGKYNKRNMPKFLDPYPDKPKPSLGEQAAAAGWPVAPQGGEVTPLGMFYPPSKFTE